MYIDSSASVIVHINLILKINRTTKYIIDFENLSIIKLYI